MGKCKNFCAGWSWERNKSDIYVCELSAFYSPKDESACLYFIIFVRADSFGILFPPLRLHQNVIANA